MPASATAATYAAIAPAAARSRPRARITARVRVRERGGFAIGRTPLGPCAAAAPPCARRSSPRRREPAGGDAGAHVGARGAGLAAGAAEAREADHDAAARAPAHERAAGIALAGVAAALGHARAEHGRGIVAVAVDQRAGGVGLDAERGLAHGVRELAGGRGGRRAPAERECGAPDGSGGAVVELRGCPRPGAPARAARGRWRACRDRSRGGCARSTTCTRAGPAPFRRRRPATTSSARLRGCADPSAVTQCAAVSTSRGPTTTAPQISPASVSLVEASISAAANGQAPAGAVLAADHGAGAAGRTDAESKATQDERT